MADPGPKTCLLCGKPKMRKLFGLPLLKTDTALMAGAKLGSDQFHGDPKVQDAYIGNAKRAGVSIQGKQYQGGLADYPGDPNAYVSDMNELRAKIKAKGAACETFGIKGREVEPQQSVAVGEDILKREVRKRIKAGADPRKLCRGEVADSISAPNKQGKYKQPARKK